MNVLYQRRPDGTEDSTSGRIHANGHPRSADAMEACQLLTQPIAQHLELREPDARLVPHLFCVVRGVK